MTEISNINKSNRGLNTRIYSKKSRYLTACNFCGNLVHIKRNNHDLSNSLRMSTLVYCKNLNEKNDCRRDRRFELNPPLSRPSTVVRIVADWESGKMIVYTCSGLEIEVVFPYDLTYLPKLVEDYLYLYSIPEDEIQQIVKWLKELVAWPSLELSLEEIS